MGGTGQQTGVPLGGLMKAGVGYAGLAMCITLVYLGMRAVMDIGGACADGGPYVVATSCPEGSTIALIGGIFLGFGFGFLATVGGAAVGGIWAAAPLFAWSGLFGALGWNFLDYGVFNADPAYGVDLGWALCGVVFWIMAFGPLLALIPAVRSMRPRASGSSGSGRGTPHAGSAAPAVRALPGPGQPDRPAPGRAARPPTVADGSGQPLTLAEARASGQTEASHAALAGIAADFGAAIGAAAAATPVGEAVPARGPGPAPSGAAEPDFTEGTQALLDRLERLADMRDRGLLVPDEYETAKAAIMAELEGRS